MYQVGNYVEMKKPHACTIKSTGKNKYIMPKIIRAFFLFGTDLSFIMNFIAFILLIST